MPLYLQILNIKNLKLVGKQFIKSWNHERSSKSNYVENINGIAIATSKDYQEYSSSYYDDKVQLS